MRANSFIAAAVTSLPLAVCAQTPSAFVGNKPFCVPQQNLVWASAPSVDSGTGHPTTGFAFVIGNDLLSPKLNYQPAPNIKGEPMAISGTLSPDRADEWLSKLPADNYWRRLAEGPKAIVETDSALHQIRAYQGTTRDRWVVWTIDPSLELVPKSIARGGSIAALCHRTDFRPLSIRKVNETTTCQRRTRRDDFFLSYTFSEANLSRLSELDSEVFRVVLSWRCGPRGAT